MMPTMFSRRHALKVFDVVVRLVLVAMMHDKIWRQIKVIAKTDQKRRLWLIVSKPPFHHQTVLKHIPV